MRTKSTKRAIAIIGTFSLAASPAIFLTGCDGQDEPMEEIGESIDDAADDVGDAVDDAVDEVDDATEG